MNITGIIVEYNPLHNGHVYHIQKTKELTQCDAVVAVMSGNFVQRGLPAMLDKWERTKMALENGVDLVLELPCVYSVSSAEFFAYGAVSLLHQLGVVNQICFGSEHGEISTLHDIAKLLVEEPPLYQSILKEYLNQGLAYPTARSAALKKYIIQNTHYPTTPNLENILMSSNNILGIEYCKSLIKLNSSIKPFTLQREGSYYNDVQLDKKYSSATAIRKFLRENDTLFPLKDHVPPSVYKQITTLKDQGYPFTFEETILPYIKYKYFTTSLPTLNILPDVAEGIENKIYKCLLQNLSFEKMVNSIKSKRYTLTRIYRILCQYFIGFDQYNTKELRTLPTPYARILGFNDKGTKILKKMKSHSNIPIYTKLPKYSNGTLALDLQATKAYSMINPALPPQSDYTISPLRYM